MQSTYIVCLHFILIDKITSDARCSDLDFKVNACEVADRKLLQVALKALVYNLIPASFICSPVFSESASFFLEKEI